MKSRREPVSPPPGPVTRAQPPVPNHSSTPARVGRATPASKETVASARRVLLWIAVVGVLLVWVLRDLVLLVGYAVLLAYALLPIVAAIERLRGPRRLRIPRGVAAAAVMLALVAIVGWLLALAVPRVGAQAGRFAAGAPEALARLVEWMRAYGAAHGLSAWLDPAVEDLRANAAGLLEHLGGTLAGWAASGLGGFRQVLGLALLPLLAFYLLAESTAVQVSALRFVPHGAHAEIVRLRGAIDRALRSYVRGQAIVCLVMGVTVGITLALLGSPLALLLGLLVAVAEVVPYLGFLVVIVAIALARLSAGPVHALVAVGAYVVINWVIGTFVTPRVMGRYLRMHPFIVTVSVLAGIQIFGPAGALLALPGAAVFQAVIGELAPPAASENEEGVANALEVQP